MQRARRKDERRPLSEEKLGEKAAER